MLAVAVKAGLRDFDRQSGVVRRRDCVECCGLVHGLSGRRTRPFESSIKIRHRPSSYASKLDLGTPLQFVKGIGPARAEMLAAKGLNTVSDLLYYAPFRYEDRRNVKPISQLAPGEKAAVLARVAGSQLS